MATAWSFAQYLGVMFIAVGSLSGQPSMGSGTPVTVGDGSMVIDSPDLVWTTGKWKIEPQRLTARNPKKRRIVELDLGNQRFCGKDQKCNTVTVQFQAGGEKPPVTIRVQHEGSGKKGVVVVTCDNCDFTTWRKLGRDVLYFADPDYHIVKVTVNQQNTIENLGPGPKNVSVVFR